MRCGGIRRRIRWSLFRDGHDAHVAVLKDQKEGR
jgi:hypothetical protein